MNMKMVKMVMMLIVIIGLVYGWQGVNMHNKVAGEEVKFHNLQNSYFSQAKSIRDSAATGSALNKDLVTLQQYPSTLLELKLIGIGRILAGIFALLFAILMALMMMPVRLAKIIKE